MEPLAGFDWDDFWEEDEEDLEDDIADRDKWDDDDDESEDGWGAADVDETDDDGEQATAEVVADVENDLGYRLPRAYVTLAQVKNGGRPVRNVHRTETPTSWAPDHVAIDRIFAIGSQQPFSLCGDMGSRFWIEEWGYPDIGIYFADTPSGGHDMLCLDYRDCGPEGEPTVVHVDQAEDFKITFVAADFESFIRGLETEDDIGDGDGDD